MLLAHGGRHQPLGKRVLSNEFHFIAHVPVGVGTGGSGNCNEHKELPRRRQRNSAKAEVFGELQVSSCDCESNSVLCKRT